MYLFHNTNIKSLKGILKDGYLKSSYLLSKEGLLNKIGEGIHPKNKYVYFSCTNKLFDKRIIGKITLYFKSDLLRMKEFYISTFHTTSPNILENTTYSKWIRYKKKYKNTNKYDNVLKKLYKHSIKILPYGKSFQVFQQIAVKNRINMKELVAIKFNKKPSDSLLNYIKKYYPEINSKIII